jgi:hypothetical protein
MASLCTRMAVAVFAFVDEGADASRDAALLVD